MNYSLFIMVIKEMMLMEAKGQPRAALTSSPLLPSKSSDPYCVFYAPPPVRRKIAQGVIYIVGFRSRWFRRGKEIQRRAHTREVGTYHVARSGDHMVGAFLPRGASCWLFLLTIFVSLKNNVPKILGVFDVLKVPKTQKYKKLGFYSIEFKPK
jgi:hypothetical protein